MTLREQLDQLIEKLANAEETTLQAALRDILTDLRHLAEERRLDYHAADQGAAQVFEDEHDENPP